MGRTDRADGPVFRAWPWLSPVSGAGKTRTAARIGETSGVTGGRTPVSSPPTPSLARARRRAPAVVIPGDRQQVQQLPRGPNPAARDALGHQARDGRLVGHEPQGDGAPRHRDLDRPVEVRERKAEHAAKLGRVRRGNRLSGPASHRGAGRRPWALASAPGSASTEARGPSLAAVQRLIRASDLQNSWGRWLCVRAHLYART